LGLRELYARRVHYSQIYELSSLRDNCVMNGLVTRTPPTNEVIGGIQLLAVALLAG